MNRRKILKYFVALPFVENIFGSSKTLPKISPKVSPKILPPTGAADAITFSLHFDNDLLISYTTITCGICKNAHDIDLIYESVDKTTGLYSAKIPDASMRCLCTKQ